MWELDHKESWAPKNWCFWTVMLEKTRVPWTARRSNQSILEEISPTYCRKDWLNIERTDAEAEASILWPVDAKNWLIWKDPDAGKDWRREEKGMREEEIVGWHHWLNGHKFKLTLGIVDEQGGLAVSTFISESLELPWLLSRRYLHVKLSLKFSKPIYPVMG